VPFAELVLDQAGPALRDAQIGQATAHHLRQIQRADAAQGVGLQVFVEQFVRIQFGTVWRQPENQDWRSMLGQSSAHRARLMDRMAIQAQKDFPPALSQFAVGACQF
jgi:hypothetical protein